MATAEFTRVQVNLDTQKSNEGAAKAHKLGNFVSNFFNYDSFAGREGSSPYNFVPTDWLVSRLAGILRVSDEDMRKK